MKPNILLIMTDQQRYDSLACYGFAGGHTPNLDRLAAEGVVFEHCYVTNPICTPSRASLMTGQHLPGHGVYTIYDILPDDKVMFPHYLRQLGYRTALFGKLHVSSGHHEAEHRHPNDGFDVYEWCIEANYRMDSAYNGYSQWLQANSPEFHDTLKQQGRQVTHYPLEYQLAHWAADRSIDFMQAESEQPFFCMMSLFEPHDPYNTYPPEFGALLNKRNLSAPLYDDGLRGKPSALKREHESSYLGGFDSLDGDTLDRIRFDYHASVAYIDYEIGRVLSALAEQGLEENTLVIFASDHGDMLGDHQLLGKGAFFFDPCVRVPLLMRWKGTLPSGRRVSSLSQLHDVALTILSAAGIPDDIARRAMPEAKNLLPVATGQAEIARDYAVCAYRNSGVSSSHSLWEPPIYATMLRDEHFKLNVFHSAGGPAVAPEFELYDMWSDPRELNNLAAEADYQGIVAGLLGRLANWLQWYERSLGARGGQRIPAPHERTRNALP